PSVAGAVAVDSPVRDITPEERAAREQRAFGPLRVYPTAEAATARFHPIPGGWSWKFDPRIFARHQLPPALLTRLDCRVALFRAEHGIVSQQMSDMMYDRLGRLPPGSEIRARAHPVVRNH